MEVEYFGQAFTCFSAVSMCSVGFYLLSVGDEAFF